MKENSRSFELSPESLKKASQLTKKLISQLDSSDKISYEIEDEVPIGDVIYNLNNLKTIITICEYNNSGKIPCLEFDENIVALDLFDYMKSLYNDSYHSIYNFKRFDFFDTILFSRFPQKDDIHFLNKTSLIQNTSQSLESFLSFRIEGVKRINDNLKGSSSGNSNRNSVNGKYLLVTVNTINSKLQISSSPSYFVTWTYFGAPTTPVSGQIQPGRYIFGGQSADSSLPKFTKDTAIVDIPPNFNVTLSQI